MIGAVRRTSSTLGLVLSFTIACRYTARGLMVNRCRKYSPAKTTSAAANAWDHRKRDLSDAGARQRVRYRRLWESTGRHQEAELCHCFRQVHKNRCDTE